MSETDQVMNEMMMQIQRGQYSMNMIARNGATAVLQIYQLICRLHREHVLKGGEVRRFEQFLRASGGNYDIIHIPYRLTDAPDGQLDQFLKKVKSDLDRMGIRYHILPDLNVKDQAFQICVYQKDRQKFGAFFNAYLDQQLSGGESRQKDLLSLTDKRASILSIPGEDRIRQIEEDFQSLRVNYSLLPDLHVGDGQVQFLVADTDLSKVRHWYNLLKDELLRAGQKPEEIRDMTVSQYQDTAKRSAEEYVNSIDPKYQAAAASYERAGNGSVEQQLERLGRKPLPAENPEFARYFLDNSYVRLSIDADTLIAGQQATAYQERDREHFYCRIPGRYGENEATLKVPMQQVFSVGDSERERYIAFISRDERPEVLDRKGNWITDYKDGAALFRSFDQVTETFRERRMEPVKKAVEAVGKVVPKAPPVMAR